MPGKKSTKELRIEMCDAGRVAADELITVAKASIFNSQNDDGQVSNEDVASEKMKIAAQAKKVSIFDCFDILDRIDTVERKMKDDEKEKEETSSSKQKEEQLKQEQKSDFTGVEGRN